jgi:pSer/pThr/pTyr-binding forkhead associated (FHA) protein
VREAKEEARDPKEGRRLVVKRAILQVCFGREAGRKIVIQSGAVLRVGRTERAEVEIRGDAQMSGAHFELSWDGETCLLRDLESATGTLVGGERALQASVPHGGWIRAGATDFLFHIEDHTPAPLQDDDEPMETLVQSEAKEQALVTLLERAAAGTLFAVLDPSRDERILVLLQENVDGCQSLYEGMQGEAMADVAPYLVQLVPDSNLLTRLIVEGWEKRWGIYLTSDDAFTEVRRHLRRLLMIEDERGNALYFRFYDPMVLSAFLPTCTPQQRGDVYGDIEAFLVEGAQGKVVLHERDPAALPASIPSAPSSTAPVATSVSL